MVKVLGGQVWIKDLRDQLLMRAEVGKCRDLTMATIFSEVVWKKI